MSSPDPNHSPARHCRRIAGVCERDIDLLLLEEFQSSRSFLSWFLEAVGQPVVTPVLVEARRAVTQASGESDLEVEWADASGARHRVLIENKVGAGFQPHQAARYRERAATYRQTGDASSILLVLVAPARYIGNGNEHGFDALVAYEAIRDWFVGREDLGPRRRYKADLLESAIDKSVLGYTPVADEPVSIFWGRYWDLVMAEHPQLEMRPPGSRAARAGFIRFFPSVITARWDLRLRHKLQHQAVDLEFANAGTRVGDLHTALSSALEPDMTIVKTGKAAAVRITVPRLDASRVFDEQIVAVRAGHAAARKLVDWWIVNADRWPARELSDSTKP